jgi:ribosome biogenesis GTPase
VTAGAGAAPARDAFTSLGWDDGWARVFATLPGAPARVTRVDHSAVRTLTRSGPVSATTAVGVPRLVTGDWVAVAEDGAAPGGVAPDHQADIPAATDDSATIIARAPRRTVMVRRDPGEEPLPQALAANIDQVWITHATEHPLRAGWIDRALVMAYGSGATPVIVVTKADVGVRAAGRPPAGGDPGVRAAGRPPAGGDPGVRAGDPAHDVDALAERVTTLAPGVAVVATSTVDGRGLGTLLARLDEGRSAALLGRSGSGKSSLINALSGASVLRTASVRATDRKGRHTTTRRALLPVAGGSVIDTPGVRALGLWEPEEGLALAFPDIAELAQRCHFNDCSHRHEPGCAVRHASDTGTLSEDRYHRYIALRS